MRGSVTLQRFATLPEALICQGFLQANGIVASVSNHQHAANNWLLIPALGGVGVCVAATDFDRSHSLLLARMEDGPALLEQAFGAYEKPRRYGVVAAWYMVLHFFQLAHLAWLVLFVALFSVLARIIPDSWVPQPRPSGSPGWRPEVRTGSYDPISESHFNIEGFLFLIVVFLVFLADRLIKPKLESRKDTT